MMNVLSNEDLRRIAPAIFSDHAHEGVSAKYSFLPTINVVEGMRREGWMPCVAQEQRVLKDSRKGFQKHMIRFRRADDVQRIAALTTRENHVVNRDNPLAEFFEIVLTNSHDRSSAYQLHAGIFRLVCRNGLCVCDSTFQKISIKHVGSDAANVIEGSFKLLEELPAVQGEIETMKIKQLAAPQAQAFAEAALIAKYGDLEAAPVNAAKLLLPRRTEDYKKDVWTTFNVVQENLVKGGLKDYAKRKENGKRFPRTRAVSSIDENVKLNKALWHLSKTLAATV